MFGQLLDILPKHFRFLKTFNSEFSYIEVQLTDQNSKPQEIDDNINITVVIHKSVTYEKWWIIQLNLEIKFLQKIMIICFLLQN